jgi:hypothetical protein
MLRRHPIWIEKAPRASGRGVSDSAGKIIRFPDQRLAACRFSADRSANMCVIARDRFNHLAYRRAHEGYAWLLLLF